ncbi:phosphoenolpyruvate synthase [Acidihalobacter prosperus]|uniref:Phosphoenolpyruvate synthase n=1 Tax=Acidihalobacter prosperus TaxID=160660 RepID=A0A1A6C4M1_9GAMM|nr:phosphoenolpyruvate synthase [Acidihalobacter prosperus]OBS09508.1 phosphoenolpyruvate--protein phosphotransferase [Acidihalobacter prosperus]
MGTEYVLWFNQVGMHSVGEVGGKNASLGEMISHLSELGVQVPNGFATTADAYREFLAHESLDARIRARLDALDVDDVNALVAAGAEIRGWLMAQPFPPALEAAIREAYARLEAESGPAPSFAVRSSATAEDLPDASFAGQQETLLNVSGIDAILDAVRTVFASLFNDRAISYRVHKGFEHSGVALSAGIQRMVRSDIGASGVMFSIDTESGFRDVVFVTASYGLGEAVVQGSVNPDEFYVHKPTLQAGRPAILRRTLGGKASKIVYAPDDHHETVVTVDTDPAERRRFCIDDADVESLARQALLIERHYGRPMDIEWGKDGHDGQVYVLQARPETVHSHSAQSMMRYQLNDKRPRKVLTEGRSVGDRIGAGTVRVIHDLSEMDKVRDGDVLVTGMTDPDWEPVMKRVAAVVTDRGGRTCHAAIIARELGIPAVVGTGQATEQLVDGTEVTVSCAEGDTGHVYAGRLDFSVDKISTGAMPEIPVKIMMNVGNPDRAFAFAGIPHRGVGLARLEFIINRMIGIHPKALLEFDRLPSELQDEIRERIEAYGDPIEFYVRRLAEGIATIGAAFAPETVIVRLSDFKSNEYANLLGGHRYEPDEENPMLGFRGASRYISEEFRPCFELECRAVRYVRETMGLTNVQIMIPFVRTVDEARQVTELLAANGLARGQAGLKVMMMCELPSNALLADDFLEYFDGFSIGSNDMTQLTLGLDRDSGVVAGLFDERNPAVLRLLGMSIEACRKAGKYVGICGQGPSDHPDLAEWLMAQGIESISLNPDTVIPTWLRLAETAGAS